MGQLEMCSSDRKSFNMGVLLCVETYLGFSEVNQRIAVLNIKRRQANFLAIPNGMQEAHLPPFT